MGKTSFNSYYQNLQNTYIDDNMIQLQLKMPKNYNKTIQDQLIKPKSKVMESNNRIQDEDWF